MGEGPAAYDAAGITDREDNRHREDGIEKEMDPHEKAEMESPSYRKAKELAEDEDQSALIYALLAIAEAIYWHGRA